jgi:predicted RNA binding protein YcfA (HicA-like mRNA interferase family)
MGRLPVLSGRALVKILERRGWVVDRQRGSHMVLRQSDPPHRRLTIPDHRELARGTLRAILRQAGMTREELDESGR